MNVFPEFIEGQITQFLSWYKWEKDTNHYYKFRDNDNEPVELPEPQYFATELVLHTRFYDSGLPELKTLGITNPDEQNKTDLYL